MRARFLASTSTKMKRKIKQMPFVVAHGRQHFSNQGQIVRPD